MTRPHPGEYAPFYASYIGLVPEDDILSAIKAQFLVTRAALLVFSDRLDHRYSPDKWSVRQVVGHMLDTERVLGHRALWIARSDPAPLPGFEQDDWMVVSGFGTRTMSDLLEELEMVRRGHLLMLRHLSPDAWERRGVVNGQPFSVRALAHALLGHERAHLAVLAERYT
ncbi:DinB family protein [Deinococcus sp.]|uniref:DinB family protein n=1 Tax=Deinococcus sp. TaxID=47478 RepID=UPI003CC51F96